VNVDTERDPVVARRSRARRWAAIGLRAGYGAYAVAMAAFAFGAVTGFSPTVVAIVVAALAAGSVVLAPAIVIGYGVRAADREDRGEPAGH
jgi:hypothetical protein